MRDCDAILRLLDRLDVGVRMEPEFVGEDVTRAVDDRGIREGPDPATATEQFDADTQAMERLPEFQTDDAGPENGDRRGEIVPVEHIVVGDQAISQFFEHRRDVRARTCGDDYAFGTDGAAIAELKFVV